MLLGFECVAHGSSPKRIAAVLAMRIVAPEQRSLAREKYHQFPLKPRAGSPCSPPMLPTAPEKHVEYNVLKQGEMTGPFSEEDLRTGVADGQFVLDDFVQI